MTGYTKLFSSIVSSTIWREDKETKIVWITMLAMADKDGIVEASIPGLADLARVTIPECQAALAILTNPDEFSRTKEHEGRRIEEIDGGWRLLNHAKYRAKMSYEERREYQRQYWHKRQTQHSLNNTQQNSTDSTHTDTEAKADTKAEANTNTDTGTKKKEGRRFAPPTPSELDLYAAKLGVSKELTEKWLAYYESNGWRVGRNLMRSWQASLRYWKNNQQQFRSSGRTAVKADHSKF